MSQSNLTRGLLLSTLVWTLSANCLSKVSAQVIDDLSLNMTTEEQTITSDQDLLQKTEIFQQKAEKFRQIIDIFNIQLQEQFNSQRTKNIVDFTEVLAHWAQLNRIWRDFTKDLESRPELFNLLQEDEFFQEIGQNLLTQKEIISNLEKVLNQSSTLIITELQEQLFTRRELSRNYYPYGTFEARTQHKFALVSTNKVRELELQASQIENIISHHLLYKKQLNNTNYGIAEPTTSNSVDTKKFVDNLLKQPDFFNFNTLIALTLLSSCAIFIILRSFKQDRSVFQAQNFNQGGNSEIPRSDLINYDVSDYLKNVQQLENQALKILNSANQIVEEKQKSQVNDDSISFSHDQSQSNSNFSDLATTKTFLSSSHRKIIQEIPPTVTSLVTEEDLILMYRKNWQFLRQKSITVAITRESIKRIKTGQKSDILFKEADSGGYWIVLEPKLENNCYFLVPNPILEINSLTLQSIDKIFTCTRYNNRTSDKFNLKYSAMVRVHSSTSWKLIGTGELTFS